MSTLTVRSLVSQVLARAAGAPLTAHGWSRVGAMGTVAGVALATLAFVPATADAQQKPAASAAVLDEVVVTGIRHAVESAIVTKRDSDNIVEAISAEDIGKLPELRRDFHRMCAQIGVDPLACLTPAT